MTQNRHDWAAGPFNDGSSARIDGMSINSAPSADVIGEVAHASWKAGWKDADEEIERDGMTKNMPVLAAQ